MKTWIALIKVALNLNFGISTFRYMWRTKSKRLWEPFAIMAAIALGLGPVLFGYVRMLGTFYEFGAQFGQAQIVVMIAILFGQTLILAFGMVIMLSVLYFSTDLPILVPLPLTPSQVLGAKFIQVAVNEYLALIPIYWPAVLIYGLRTPVSFLFWPAALVIYLLLPLLPLLLSGLVLLPLMKVGGFRKRRESWAMVVSLVILLAIAVFQFFFQRSMARQGPEALLKTLFETNLGLLRLIGRIFPPSLWAVRAVTEAGQWSGLGYLGLYLLLSFFMLVILNWLARRLFYGGLLSLGETFSKKKELSHTALQGALDKVTRIGPALVWKEWKLFWRTPIWVVNCFLGGWLIPVFLLLPLTVMPEGAAIPQLSLVWRNPGMQVYGALALAGISMVMTSLFSIGSSAVSREGAHFWLSKTIPVSFSQQARSKLNFAMILSVLAIFPTWVLAGVIAKLPILPLIAGIVLGLVGMRLVNSAGMIIDYHRPYLDWDNPQKAVKNNLNVLLGMLMSVWLTGLGAIVIYLGRKAGWSPLMASFPTALYLMLAAWGVDRLLHWVAIRSYRRNE